jgi:hypothetical protein
MNNVPVGFGLPNEWEQFIKDHPVLMQKIQAVYETLKKVFIRSARTSEPADRVVFYLGRLCAEDFSEITLLCGNGYGVAGLKILRGMYEKAVTSAYIAKNPEEVELFLDYHLIHQKKALNHLKQVYNADELREVITESQMEKIQNEANRVREQFKEVLCEKCNITRDRFSWSKLGMPDMARIAGDGYRQLYYPCYYRPTLQTHTTVAAIIERLAAREDGSVTFNEGAQREAAHEAMLLVHNLIIQVINTQNDYFSLGLEEEIKELVSDFQEVWRKTQDSQDREQPS